MLDLNLYEIKSKMDAKFLKEGTCLEFTRVSTDTRDISLNDIFIALKGPNFNGNDYVLDAINKGASLCIVDEHIDITNLNVPNNVSILKVNDSVKSLGKLAKYYRNKLNIKVVGVTGSVGKTSTKDIVAAVLSSKYNVLKTRGNLNNHIGLPLMILELDPCVHIAVLEMGMNHSKEIEYLADIARPDVAIITNIGINHIEHLGSKENILKAKMEITSYFNNNNTLIVNGDDDFLKDISESLYKTVRVSINNKPNHDINNIDLCAEDIVTNEGGSTFDVLYNNIRRRFSINMPGVHNVYNFLLAMAVGKEFGIDDDSILESIENIVKTNMRLDIIKSNDITIINDCYNASPASMIAAIDVAINIKGKRHICVLGTMKELGEFSKEAHIEVAEYLKNNPIDFIFTTGEHTQNYKDILSENCFYFNDKRSLISSLKREIMEGDVILVKASRGAHFEDIVDSLEKRDSIISRFF